MGNMYNFSNKRIINASSLIRLEFIYILISLSFFSGGLSTILGLVGAIVLEKVLRYVILGISLVYLYHQRSSVVSLFKANYWILALICLTIFSFTWSAAPAISIESIRAEFLPMTAFGIYLANRFNHREMSHIIYAYAFMTALISFFFIFAMPDVGRHPALHAYPGAWKGIFLHKNAFGLNLSILSILIGIKALYGNRSFILPRLFLFLFITFAIISSQSTGALIISVFSLGLIWVFKQFKLRGKISAFIAYLTSMAIILAGVIVNVFWSAIAEAIGKTDTSQSRFLIWDFLLDRVSTSPFLGFGKGVFWKMPRLFAGVFQASGDAPANAHNGYIELILDLGYVGLFIFIVSTIIVVINSVRISYKANKIEDLWPIAFTIIFLIWNYNESLILKGTNVFWILFLYLSLLPLSKKNRTESKIPDSEIAL